MTAYYNEHDPKAAAWLRELIKEEQTVYDERIALLVSIKASMVEIRPTHEPQGTNA